MPRTRQAFPPLSDNALTILRRRYLAKNSAGRPVETPDAMFRRVARNIAQAEHCFQSSPSTRKRALSRATPHTLAKVLEQSFFNLMRGLDFLPNSPTLMNAGRPLQQLSACFVLPVEDSLEQIFETLRHQALIHQSGGGTGFSFSHLRPKNDRVATTGGVASGPVSFMRIFNAATEVIKQGGTRRGANMGILRVDHPDILEFIAAKHDLHAMTNFNTSVGITDHFMRALARKQTYALRHPRTRRPIARMHAEEVFDRIVASAWGTGEPGVVFLDTMNHTNPTPQIGVIEATNPCGEQPLLPYESCILGSMNLAQFCTNSGGTSTIDFDRLAKTIPLAVRFLDNVIEVNRFPLPTIESTTKGTRKIGLGIMGFADLLVKMGIPYDTPEALSIADHVMGFLKARADEASEALARERRVFPSFQGSRLARLGRRLRNATLTTVAPTGSISIIAGCSAGIEPFYGVSVTKTVMEDIRLVSVHPEFLARAEAAGILSRQLLERVAAQESIQTLLEIPEEIRRLFVTAHDIPPDHHVRMQAVFQRHSDSGVSKTINLPAHVTKAEVASAFRLAYSLGCKGITVFRSGSREHQVLSCAHVQYC